MFHLFVLFIGLIFANSEDLASSSRPLPIPIEPLPSIEPLPAPPILPPLCDAMPDLYPTGVCVYDKLVWSEIVEVSSQCTKVSKGKFTVRCDLKITATCAPGRFVYDYSKDEQFCATANAVFPTCFLTLESITKEWDIHPYVTEDVCGDATKARAACQTALENLDRIGYWEAMIPEMAGLHCGGYTRRGQISCCPKLPTDGPQPMPAK